ncbi:unnamed protein product [Anisakis simplex]|uniref:Molybdopterin synthase catalytic subunit (inferred by orthology to a D. melanogaster protein) n=1 Tax=Anisakis simplex TaxID=6269 RepID=A0A0M3K3C8_ANISI|nr:unnamed protein product [Anisakis simplex]
MSESSLDLLRIQEHPIRVEEAIQFVTAPTTGGTSVFVGTTRDTFDGKRVVQLEYEAYEEMAIKEMHRVCEMIREKFPSVRRAAIIHRTGVVPVGESSVVIAVSAPHRRDAIRGNEMAIDLLKRRVPIWKKVSSELFTCFHQNG